MTRRITTLKESSPARQSSRSPPNGLAALQHLIRAAQALAEDVPLLVPGSSPLLASFPELGDPQGPLTSTFDADLCPLPFNELTAMMLGEALGEDRAYFRITGLVKRPFAAKIPA